MLKSKKHVFWEALLITIVVFLAGLFLGMLIEAANSAKISSLYLQSEISLTDASATARLAEDISKDDSWTDVIGYAALGGEIINDKS